ncbi:hypothetical protein BS47DRAFT_1365874 [Hydnum rufescens UP504]|uniref:Uncharacterized protein n=1 Tax=Hydnum rufescens UP504 TaxID=1448309 RepID=A0A9P6AMK4_9AGAM|nr:hypothetical protein BS47DRAFT_1365874 [Hydnum rufescens UP504]
MQITLYDPMREVSAGGRPCIIALLGWGVMPVGGGSERAVGGTMQISLRDTESGSTGLVMQCIVTLLRHAVSDGWTASALALESAVVGLAGEMESKGSGVKMEMQVRGSWEMSANPARWLCGIEPRDFGAGCGVGHSRASCGRSYNGRVDLGPEGMFLFGVSAALPGQAYKVPNGLEESLWCDALWQLKNSQVRRVYKALHHSSCDMNSTAAG